MHRQSHCAATKERPGSGTTTTIITIFRFSCFFLDTLTLRPQNISEEQRLVRGDMGSYR
jgi:hypothetical protein